MATIIDNDFQPQSASVWPTALKYGLYIGAISIVLQLLSDLLGFNAYSPDAGFVDKALGWLGTIIGIVLLVQAVKHVRDSLQGGRITFGKAFGTAMATSLIAVLIAAVWTYVYFAFINGDALEEIKELSLQNAQFDEDAEGADTALSFMNAAFSPGGFAVSALFGGLIIYAIIDLIIAAVMKKD